MNKLKTIILTILGIPIAMASGVIIDDRVIESVELKTISQKITKAEYRSLRGKIANAGSKDRLECFNAETGEYLCDINAVRKNDKEGSLNMAWQNQQLYLEMLNKEKDKCNGKLYNFNSKEDIRNLLKRFEDEGCPK